MPNRIDWPITTVSDTFGTVTNVSSTIVAANEHRLDLAIVNDSDVVIYLARGNTAIVGSGIRLNPNGAGVYNIDEHNLFLGDINAISGAGDQVDDNVTISEGSRQ